MCETTLINLERDALLSSSVTTAVVSSEKMKCFKLGSIEIQREFTSAAARETMAVKLGRFGRCEGLLA